MNILLVEDEEKIADFVISGFDLAGFTTSYQKDGPGGLQAALTGQFDIIVLDVMLPGLSGIAVLEQIRLAKLLTPVIILTAKIER